jgi:hypothetical protein
MEDISAERTDFGGTKPFRLARAATAVLAEQTQPWSWSYAK